ncbi:MAG: sigma-70 family RNA polymerase sigma factor [Lachnospiraceae bacterium]|nr:sigma-70 family RNA polymerase sigma factor [Lachnospiraceae bacterium]
MNEMLFSAINFNDEDTRDMFHQIYMENSKIMYCVAYGILKNKADAEDAVHAAFVSMAENFYEIKDIECSKIKGLCVLLSKHKAIDLIRKRKHFSNKGIEDDELVDEQLDGSPEKHYLYKEQIKYANQILDQLPYVSKEILILKYYYGLESSEIANMIGISKKNVEMKIYRAKNKIREIMKNEQKK